MKKFNIAKQPQEILGRKFPANTVYGHIMLKYTVKIPTGEVYRVTDKNGHLVLDKDGNPITRHCTRIENRTQEVYYAVQDFQPQSFADGAYFRAWIKTTMDARWHETVLCRNAWMKRLNTFIAQKMRDNGIDLTTAWFNTDIKVHSSKTAHKVAQNAAHRREVQSRFIYYGGEGQILRARHAINENVQFNADGSSVKSVIAAHKNAFNGRHGEEPAKYDRPYTKTDYEMVGKEPTFVKFIEMPSGILKFYNKCEYNNYVTAQK